MSDSWPGQSGPAQIKPPNRPGEKLFAETSPTPTRQRDARAAIVLNFSGRSGIQVHSPA